MISTATDPIPEKKICIRLKNYKIALMHVAHAFIFSYFYKRKFMTIY